MTRIEAFGHELTFDGEGYAWRCSTAPELATFFNLTLDDEGPSGDDPNPPYTAALFARDRFGAKILEMDPTEKIPKGAVA